ncbi:MAG: hypothetical protein RSD88_07425 [Anaerovoracaceae bacterium]
MAKDAEIDRSTAKKSFVIQTILSVAGLTAAVVAATAACYWPTSNFCY